MSLQSYLQDVNGSIRYNEGEKLARLLSLRDPHVESPRLFADGDSIGRFIQKALRSPWDELVDFHARCVQHARNENFLRAFEEQQAFIQVLVKILQTQKEENWCLPLMYTACLDIRLLGIKADRQAKQRMKNYKPGELLEKSAESVMSCFRVCASDNRAATKDSKRLGMLHLVNQLFKIYYRVNTLHLCKPLIRAIDNSPCKEEFSLSQQVTYRYFVGRKAVFDNELKEANDYLSFAFNNCHPEAKTNIRQILIYLIPVKMLLGFQPSTALLKKHDLMKFAPICEAVKKGNVLKFQEELDINEAYFYGLGVYLILERLRMVLYRNLFKRVFLILETYQIPIEAFLVVLQLQKVEDIDLEETQCILANLVYHGKIKGYISLQHSKLVVSKKDPFPKLSSIIQ
ncbi:PCI domain-containing protein 2-like [Varroa jacobsoni]|nr:PCI domain-containing protein 2-like isoform X2 [Varroa destructor]XP_022647261.1 PCI domain-containing protein 2-like isoform X2 [Varroa destructor]XP_022692098.1 PCI domain-containing protein 2-like [Varroa jacobsoni]